MLQGLQLLRTMAALEVLKHGLPGHYIHPNESQYPTPHLHGTTSKSTSWTEDGNIVSPTNETLNVMLMNCFDHFDTLACTRSSLMSALVLLSGLVCGLKLCHLYCHHPPTFHQHAIFSAATLQCALCAVHWLTGHSSRLQLVTLWLLLLQLLVVSLLYWTVVRRCQFKRGTLTRILTGLHLLALLYFTTVVVLGCVYTSDPWTECFQPYWLAVSTGQLVLVQCFTVAAAQITKRLNEISCLDSVRREQKRDLAVLVVFFQISALCGFIYDLTLRIIGNETEGCSAVFLNSQQVFTPVHGTFTILRFLLPVWGLLFVFHPGTSNRGSHSDLAAHSDDGRYDTVFRPAVNRSTYRPISYNTARSGGGFANSVAAEENSFAAAETPPYSGGSSSASTTPVFGPGRQAVPPPPSRRTESNERLTSLESDANAPDFSDTRLML